MDLWPLLLFSVLFVGTKTEESKGSQVTVGNKTKAAAPSAVNSRFGFDLGGLGGLINDIMPGFNLGNIGGYDGYPSGNNNNYPGNNNNYPANSQYYPYSPPNQGSTPNTPINSGQGTWPVIDDASQFNNRGNNGAQQTQSPQYPAQGGRQWGYPQYNQGNYGGATQYPNQGNFGGNSQYPQGNYPNQMTQYPNQGNYPNQMTQYPNQGNYPNQMTQYPNQGNYPNQMTQYPNQGNYPNQMTQYPNQGNYPNQMTQYPNQGNFVNPQYPNQGNFGNQMPQNPSNPVNNVGNTKPVQFPDQEDNWNQNQPGTGQQGGTLDSIVPPANTSKTANTVTPETEIPPFQNPTDGNAILGNPVKVPTETTEAGKISYPTSTLSPFKKQCVQDCQTTTEYNPVCGSDNITYINPGKFVCARNCGINVFVAQQGRCPT